MTSINKLFYAEPELQTLNTEVVAKRQENGRYLVVLAQTIFYPTGGGQPHDLGSINGLPLLEVYEEDGKIYHALEKDLDQDQVECVLDWPRRFDHMQQHSGQHLLSALFQDEYGYATESFHLGAEHCSIDLSARSLPMQEQQQVEHRVNEIILKNLPVLTYQASPAELATLPLRKLPDLPGDLRIVEIEGLDFSPCAGTHVNATGKIGLLKIIKSEKYKGMSRVYFLCGNRALRDYERKHQLCQELSGLLAVQDSELPHRVAAEQQHKRELEKKTTELKRELLGLQAKNAINEGCSPFFMQLPGGSPEDAKTLATAILELTPACVVVELDERLILAHNLPGTLDLGRLITEQAKPLGGRGGGTATGAQVYFAERRKLTKFHQYLKDYLMD